MSPPKKSRAKGANLPTWWLNKVREIADERKETLGENFTELARLLSEAAHRSPPWEHSAVSRFLGEKVLTVPMAEAFSIVFGIPRPFYEPRSFDEALSMQQVARRYDDKVQQIAAGQRRRLALADGVMEDAEQDARDQTDGVDSMNERRSRRRRSGRAARGRSSAS